MKIRIKAFLAVVWVFVAGWAVFFVLFDTIYGRLVATLERETARQDLERAMLALNKEAEALSVLSRDWASRPDVLALVMSGDPSGLAVKSDYLTFSQLGIHFLAFINEEGRVLYAEGYDAAGSRLTLPPQIIWTRPEIGPLKGLAITDYGPVLVAAYPIVAQGGPPSPRGVVVMARLLEDGLTEELALLTRLSISVRAFQAGEIARLKPQGQLATGQVFYTFPVSEEKMGCLVPVRDVFGQPRLVLQVNFERSALGFVRSIRRVLQAIMLVAVAASFALTWAWLDRGLLARVIRLTRKVSEAGPEAGVRPELLRLAGNDELALLSQEIGQMVRRIADYQKAIREQERRYQEVVVNAAEAIVVVQDERIRLVNRAAAMHTGYPEEQLLGRDFLELVYPADREAVRQEYDHLLVSKEAILGFRFRVVTREGMIKWAEANSVVVDWEGRPATLHFLSDITPRRILEEELERLTAEKSLILDTLTERVIFLDRELRVIWANRAAAEAAGADPYYLIGAYCYQVWQGRDTPCEGCPVLEAMESGRPRTAEITCGQGRYCQVSASPVKDDQGRVVGAVESVLDVTERHRYEEELRYLSTHDVLTGIYNRAFFQEEMNRLTAGRDFPVTVLVADMDGLKLVNDTWGHAKGDEMLVKCARILQGVLRRGDVLARVGGDEFAVLLPRTDAGTAAQVAERILRALEDHNARSLEIPLSLSLGWATCTEGEESLEETYRKADQRMYAHKAANREVSRQRLEQRTATGAQERPGG
ncbi:MAG: diguanylate cyclase domain-containing protein [Moorellales bacterium]